MIPKMPDEYKGDIIKKCGYTTTTPRAWSEEEIKWLKYMTAHGCSTKEIAESMGRSCVSVSIKRKRLSKKSGGYKRWRRLDFVRTHYDITSIEDFTIDSLVSYIQKIGFRNKKKLIVQYKKEWNNIGRVWFSIEPVKIVEQWEKNNG